MLLTKPCSVEPNVVGENDVKFLWQALQSLLALNGMCLITALATPLAAVPLWQEAQVAVPTLAWLKVVFHVRKAASVWQLAQFWPLIGICGVG